MVVVDKFRSKRNNSNECDNVAAASNQPLLLLIISIQIKMRVVFFPKNKKINSIDLFYSLFLFWYIHNSMCNFVLFNAPIWHQQAIIIWCLCMDLVRIFFHNSNSVCIIHKQNIETRKISSIFRKHETIRKRTMHFYYLRVLTHNTRIYLF